MLNRSASLAMSTSVLKALPGKLDIKRREPGILYLPDNRTYSAFVTNTTAKGMTNALIIYGLPLK